jgi:undecaprenyl-diphosphatase
MVFGGPARYSAIGAAAVASLTGIAVFRFLKKTIGRKRPCATKPHNWAKLLPPDQFSFPSGHSITAFAVVLPLSLFYPSWTIALLFCATSVAISRVVLGMHYLSDVVVGCLIGAGLGYLSFSVFS